MARFSRPSLLSRTLALVPPTVLLVAQHASGAFDAYLKIGDIQGESTDAKHPGWIELDSVQWGVGRDIARPVNGTRAVSTPSISELTLTKKLDKSSPSIFLNAVGGSSGIDTVTLELVNPDTQVVFYRITLSNVLVSGQFQSGASGGDVPQESVSLNFTKIKMEYFFQDAKSVTTAIPAVGWDFALQQKFP